MREEARTPKGNLKKPSRQHVLDFVAEAWAAVPEETVARSFKRCDISNTLDGSEDGDLHSGLQAECCDLFLQLTRRSLSMVLKAIKSYNKSWA